VRFEFATAGEIVFGRGTRDAIAERVRAHGRRAFVVLGRPRRSTDEVLAQLGANGIARAEWRLDHEPTIEDARLATEAARAHGTDVVLAIGGGTVIDLGKAVSALITNEGDPLDYVEVVGRGRLLTARAAPLVAVPTTAGAGAEVTRNAVLTSTPDGMKVSLRSVLMIPRLALVDPELTVSLPPDVTAATGMDALTQLIEPYVSPRATPITDGLCLEGIRRVTRSLRTAVADGANMAAREDMALASLFGGIALANAGLGAVHGFAAAIGGRFPAPHGAVCAALLPEVMRVNLRAAHAHEGTGLVERVTSVARILTGDPDAGPEAGVEWLRALRADLGIPALRRYGITTEDAGAIVDAASKASSMRGNPVPLERHEMLQILDGTI